MRDSGPFVIPRDKEHGDPGPGRLQHGLECLVGQGRGDPGPVEEVPAVDHQVHPQGQGLPKDLPVVLQEVRPSPAPFDSGLKGEIEAQMGIPGEEDTDPS